MIRPQHYAWIAVVNHRRDTSEVIADSAYAHVMNAVYRPLWPNREQIMHHLLSRVWP